MLERLQAHLKSSGLIPTGASVLVGYSGGADSTCMIHLLHQAGIDLVAAHLHHGQRPEADLEMKLCERFCEELGVPFVGGRADVPKMAADMGVGLEEAGREARYHFFSRAATGANCSLIATAHTRTDLVETLLLNISRGSGLSGLGSIPERRGNIVRPMLIFTRAQTKAYCEENSLWHHDDPSNSDLSFGRARIRHRVCPELKAINPRYEDALSRLAAIATEEDRFLNGMAAAALEHAEVKLNGDLRFLTVDVEACFERELLLQLPEVLFKRAMRLAAGALGAVLDFDQVQVLAHGLTEMPCGSITAEGGQVALEWNESRVHVRQLSPTEPFRYPIEVPGETLSDEFGWRITAQPSSSETEPVRASLRAAIEPSQTRGQLYFRTAEPGDHMQPLGFGGHRKLADILSESKLTQAARSRLPIVCDMIGPLWAPGICLDERARPRSSSALVLEFGPTHAE